jgi:hypothetical protein
VTADVDVLSWNSHPLLDHPRQELPRASHEGDSLRVLFRAGGLAHEEDPGLGTPVREDGLGPSQAISARREGRKGRNRPEEATRSA